MMMSSNNDDDNDDSIYSDDGSLDVTGTLYKILSDEIDREIIRSIFFETYRSKFVSLLRERLLDKILDDDKDDISFESILNIFTSEVNDSKGVDLSNSVILRESFLELYNKFINGEEY